MEVVVKLEIPAGKLDSKNEIPENAALRELSEETGALIKGELIPLGDFYPTPAYSDELIRMYAARVSHIGNTSPDEDEFLNVCEIPLEKLTDMILNGEIADSKTQAAILKVYILSKRNLI